MYGLLRVEIPRAVWGDFLKFGQGQRASSLFSGAARRTVRISDAVAQPRGIGRMGALPKGAITRVAVESWLAVKYRWLEFRCEGGIEPKRCGCARSGRHPERRMTSNARTCRGNRRRFHVWRQGYRSPWIAWPRVGFDRRWAQACRAGKRGSPQRSGPQARPCEIVVQV